MSITERLIDTGTRRRRTHSTMFKAEAVGACQQPGISITVVALPPSVTDGAIRIEVRGKGRSVSIEWPASAAREYALLPRAGKSTCHPLRIA